MKVLGYIQSSLALAAALCGAAACEDGSYFGLTDEEIVVITTGTGASAPEPVVLAVGDYGRTSSTKGLGVVLDRWDWSDKGASLKVYAFRRDSACYTSTAVESTDGCLIDGTIDNAGVKSGREATFSAPEFVLRWPFWDGESAQGAKEVQYPSGKVPYDFFAYSTGGVEIPEASIDRQKSYIAFPVKIDGLTDLMYAKAELTASQKETFASLGLESEEELAQFGNWCFSDYSARYGIIPVLNFRHALTRINFDIYPAEEGCNRVIIDHVTVTTRDSCVFTVASADSVGHPLGVDFSSDEKDVEMFLREADGTALNDTLYHTSYYGDFKEDILERPSLRLGGGLLLPPDSEYKFTFYTKVNGYTDTNISYLTVRPKKTDTFLAGSNYIVRIAMNDLTPVLFDADVDPWGDGGDVNSGH